ncbi:MAG: LamG-like jellyroll fold domain-containing protein [bacterium]
MKKIIRPDGFGLIELTVVIIVLAVLAGIAMQSLTVVVEDARTVGTKREMEELSRAIVGDPSIMTGGMRSDFGYVGDVGAFPPNLQALTQNPGGYSSWDGPYIDPGFTQDTDGYRLDQWGTTYTYSGGTTISSTGGGSTITQRIADATSDYLVNTVNGVVTDDGGTTPGAIYKDSVSVSITTPNGSGAYSTRTVSPDSAGLFALDSLPVGQHRLQAIYVPVADTLTRIVTVLPRHNGPDLRLRFATGYFGGGGSGGGSGSDSGLVGHWKLDETSGTTASDASGYGNHGTLINMSGSEWTTGKIGGALEFDGSNDRVIIPDDDILDDTEQLTMAAWVYAHILDNKPRGLLSKRVSHTTQYAYSMFFYSSDRLNVDINTQNNRFACPLTFHQNRWYHIAVVYDGTLTASNRSKVYVDGSLIHTATESSSSIPNLNSPLVIGLLNGNSSGFFDGLIDDVHLYNRALTPSEVQALYDMGS